MTTEPLKYSKEARQRIIVGLRWDPRDLPFYLRWIIPKQYQDFDLDLTCYIYNQNKDFVGIVSGEDVVNEDCDGAIYHSGDEKTGEFSHDDEQISVELSKLDDDITDIFFIVTCKSAHNFGKIKHPVIRLADGKSNKNQYVNNIYESSTSTDHDALVFARIFRDKKGWMLEKIDDWATQKDIDDWPGYLNSRIK